MEGQRDEVSELEARPSGPSARGAPTPSGWSSPASQVLALQRAAGNCAVAGALARGSGLRDLPGGNSPRPLPRPALPVPTLQPSAGPAAADAALPAAIAAAGPGVVALARFAAAGRSDDLGAHGATAAGLARAAAARAGARPDAAVSALGSGAAVPQAERARFEEAYGYRLDAVRLHTGPVAARVTEALGAHAVTLGDHVLLGRSIAPGTAAGGFVLGHELAHVVQSRHGSGASLGRINHPGHPAEREATAASLSALQGRPAHILEATGDDPQLLAWWVLALIGVAVAGAVWGTTEAVGPSTEENRRRRARSQRSGTQDVLAWVPIAGSVQDIIDAETDLQRAFGVAFLAFDIATLGGTGMVVRGLARVPGAALRVLARGGGERGAAQLAERGAARVGEEAAERGVMQVAGEEVTQEAVEQAGRELTERGGSVASTAVASQEISAALGRRGAVVLAVEGGHAVMFANTAEGIVKVHGGPLFMRIKRVFEEGAQEVAERAVTSGTGREGRVTAYAIVNQGAPLTLEAVERMPRGLSGVTEAVGRALFGNPTSCGIVQGATVEMSGLSAEAAARLFPAGSSGRYFPITIVDRWVESGAGRLVEGGAAQIVYGARSSTVAQATMAVVQVAGRTVLVPVARNAVDVALEGDGANGGPTVRGGGARSSAGGGGGGSVAGEAGILHQLESAAVTIVERCGNRPGAGEIATIRDRLLPELVPGWFVLDERYHREMGGFLRSAGMSDATVQAILGI